MTELLELWDVYIPEIADARGAGIPDDALSMIALLRNFHGLSDEIDRLNAEAMRVVAKYQI